MLEKTLLFRMILFWGEHDKRKKTIKVNASNFDINDGIILIEKIRVRN
jgi:hypothetical protein